MSDDTLVRIEAVDGTLVAEMLTRELTDLESGAVFEDIVRAAHDLGWRVVIDCTRFETLSSSGIGMFVKLQRLCAKNTGSVAMCGLSNDLLKRGNHCSINFAGQGKTLFSGERKSK